MACSLRFRPNETRCAITCFTLFTHYASSLNKLLQVAHLEAREVNLKEEVVQLNKKLNGMQRVYMKGVKSSVEQIRAGRAALGGAGNVFSSSAGDIDEAQ